MIDTAILKAMAAAGASVDVIIAAVEAAQVSEEQKLTERRAKDAERQRRRRASLNVTPSHAESRGRNVTKDEALSFLLTDSENKKEESKKERKKAAQKKSLCPADFQPTESNLAYGKSLGFTPAEISEMALEMREWSASTGSTKLEWPLTLNVWMRRKAGERKSPYGQGRSRQLQDDSKSVSRALERQQREGSVQFGPRPRLLPDDSQGDMRLLPPRRGTGS
jgi:hypothetical protein